MDPPHHLTQASCSTTRWHLLNPCSLQPTYCWRLRLSESTSLRLESAHLDKRVLTSLAPSRCWNWLQHLALSLPLVKWHLYTLDTTVYSMSCRWRNFYSFCFPFPIPFTVDSPKFCLRGSFNVCWDIISIRIQSQTGNTEVLLRQAQKACGILAM